MAAIVLKEEIRNNKPWCLLVAEVNEGKLIITRIDFEEWERNNRNGQVEISYIFDASNTGKMMDIIGEDNHKKLLKYLKRHFKGKSGLLIMEDIKSFCNAHNIDFDYSVWY